MKHNVSYIELDDNHKLDYHILQALQNGFTFTCVLNEQDVVQSNFLLNIRLESDNATLVWSRPAWDISESWMTTTSATGTVNANSAAQNMPIGGELNADAASKNSKFKKHRDESNKDLSSATIAAAGAMAANRSRSQINTSLINNSLLMPFEATRHIARGATFRSRSQKFLEKNFLPQFKKNQTIKLNTKSKLNKSLTARRKLTVSADARVDNHHHHHMGGDLLKSSLLNQRAKRLKRLNSISDECTGSNKQNKKMLSSAAAAASAVSPNSSTLYRDRSLSVSSLSFDDNQGIVCDTIDPNIIYSVSSLTKRYVYREPVSVTDPNEGFMDLNAIKHLRRGCLDTQAFNMMHQQIAGKYAISNFDHANVISVVYGTTFAENRYI
jgi:hypothetical protein